MSCSCPFLYNCSHSHCLNTRDEIKAKSRVNSLYHLSRKSTIQLRQFRVFYQPQPSSMFNPDQQVLIHEGLK